MKKLFYIIFLFAFALNVSAQTISVVSFDGFHSLVVNQYGTWGTVYSCNENTTVTVKLVYSNGVVDSVNQSVLSGQQYLSQFSRSFSSAGTYTIDCQYKISGSIITTRQLTVVVTGLTDVEDTDIPTGFYMAQNYPNPFNPSTEIKYYLPIGTNIILQVFDLNGRLVETLIDNQILSRGEHVAKFDGAKYSSGIYIYRIMSGMYNSTKKMILMK